MSDTLTFPTTSDRAATWVASLIFLLPGLSALVFGVLTAAGLTWVSNTSNGLLVGVTGTIWALVGLGLIRFKRWTVVDTGRRVVERGTRTLFRHPAERYPFDDFRAVQVRSEPVAGGRFYVVVLHFDPKKRPGRASQPELWLHTWGTVEEAREAGDAVAERTGLPLTDSTRGDLVTGE
jgi:hypothetical protein